MKIKLLAIATVLVLLLSSSPLSSADISQTQDVNKTPEPVDHMQNQGTSCANPDAEHIAHQNQEQYLNPAN